MDVAARVEMLGHRSQGLVTAAALEAAGVSRSARSRAAARGEIHRVAPRVYALSPMAERPRWLVTDLGVAPAHVLRLRAELLSRPEAWVRGTSAAVVRGWPLLVEPTVVELGVRHQRRSTSTPRLAVVQARSPDHHLLSVLTGTDPLPVQSPGRIVLEALAQLPEREAVVLADSALRSGAVTLEELCEQASGLAGRPGAALLRSRLALLDPLSGSVLESVQRLALVRAGLTDFTTQEVLCRLPYVRADFCFRGARLVLEVDGARWHPDPARDRRRDNLLAALGWRVLRLTWGEVVGREDEAVAQVRAALAATDDVHLAPAMGWAGR